MDLPVILIGYGGHGLVSAEILLESNFFIHGYCDSEEKRNNPFSIPYKGKEKVFFNPHNCNSYSAFISIGASSSRKDIFGLLSLKQVQIINAIHPKAVVSTKINLGRGVFIAANATINPCCKIGDGVICNTSSSIDHECTIGDFTHICPGTVLCGNVTVGKNSFIGANSTVIPGITIGDKVMVGAGSTVVKDILSPGIYVGSPARLLKPNHKQLKT
jgi:sugar O-acyltransferase (sialic acid O-acetyltransferase NeuD family)